MWTPEDPLHQLWQEMPLALTSLMTDCNVISLEWDVFYENEMMIMFKERKEFQSLNPSSPTYSYQTASEDLDE